MSQSNDNICVQLLQMFTCLLSDPYIQIITTKSAFPPPPLSVLTFLACCSADGGHAGCGSQLFQNLRGHWLEEVQDLVLQGHKLQVGPQGLETLKLRVGLQCTSGTLTSVRVAGKSLWPSA